MKVKSDRAVKYTKELISFVMAKLNAEKLQDYKLKNYHLKYQTVEQMLVCNPPLVKLINGELGNEKVAVAEDTGINYKYRYSFNSRLILNGEPIQTYYQEIKNELLSYKNVKSKVSWNHDAFNLGRNKCAIIKVKGKTLCVYLPLSTLEYEQSKYHFKEVTGKKAENYPMVMKVKSDRAVKYTKELISFVMAKLNAEKLQDYKLKNYHLKYQTVEQMLVCNPPLVKLINGELESLEVPVAEDTGINYKYRYSFMARLIQSEEDLKEKYTFIKNYLLSFDNVKSGISWGRELFRVGKKGLIVLKIKGKSLAVYYKLNPEELEERYHVKNKDGEFPCLLKVKSDRSLKYAIEIADKLLTSLSLNKNEIVNIKYDLQYKTTKQLLNLPKPLVKEIKG